jgi:hypothetical protein
MTLARIAVQAVVFFVLIAVSGCTSSQLIRPGTAWLDNRGEQIQAHGGGIMKMGGVYYWFGEDRSRGNDPNYHYVACDSDPENLVHSWVLIVRLVSASRNYPMTIWPWKRKYV